MPINLYFDTIFANAGDRTVVPDPIQGSGTVSYEQGYSISYSTPVASGGYDFPRNQHNQILYDITAAIQNLQQNGAPNFITSAMNGGSAFSYILGAIAAYDAGSGLQVWISTAASNTTVPGAGGAHWTPLQQASSPLYIGGASTGSANAQAIVTNQGNFANTAGNIVTFKAGISVTSSATLSVDSVSNIPIKVISTGGLRNTQLGDIVIGGEYIGISDGTNIQLINPTFVSGQSETGIMNGRKLAWASNSTINVSASSAILVNSLSQTIKVTSASATLNSGTSGANGIDTGSVAASTWYYVWGIYNPTTTTFATLLSLSATAPTLPGGYTYQSVLGVARTDGSANFIGFTQQGNEWQYQVGSNLSGLPLVTSGALGSTSGPTYVSTSISNFVPTTVAAKFHGIIFWDTGSDWAIVAPNNSYGAANSTSNPAPVNIGYASNNTANQFSFLLESSNIFYASDNAQTYVYCRGFSLNI